ncbi:TPA: dimethylmenaquinone methyltransferase [Candidatus Latescibacteria bacterium]|nr:dimethylmenaquinone methyltransferase [Candidatus Latescibacterota bacterium]|tara:strand:+ start:57 stop:782 length:726 start_codon:yes stop_codon:yes gene_type:complete
MPEGLSPQQLDELRKYDTPTICNAIELFDVHPRNVGYMNQIISACFPEMPPMVGYASTATWRADAPAVDGREYGSIDGQVESFAKIPGPPVVVFQDLDEPTVAASFGEVMCTTYKTFGAVGLVTSGAARDLDQVRAIGFPAFSNGVNPSHGYGHIVDVMIPVHVGGVTVLPGDLLHGDCNGVTTIPNAIASELVDIVAEFVAAEEIVLDHLNSESPTVKGFAEARKAYKAVVDELTARVRK